MSVTADSRAGPDPVATADHPVHPMYERLLEAVLNDETAADTPPTGRAVGPLAELVRLRHTMDKHAERTDPGWALQAVADQLAYDAALVRLARKRGVPVDLDDFDVPERGRSAIEQALVAKGINLPVSDPAPPTRDQGADTG